MALNAINNAARILCTAHDIPSPCMSTQLIIASASDGLTVTFDKGYSSYLMRCYAKNVRNTFGAVRHSWTVRLVKQKRHVLAHCALARKLRPVTPPGIVVFRSNRVIGLKLPNSPVTEALQMITLGNEVDRCWMQLLQQTG